MNVSPSLSSPRSRVVPFAALLCLSASSALAQAASADYTADLPSVQKVETQLQGTDPTDTAARQVAVFEYLQVYIQRIRDGRQYNGPYTPGELKLRTDYAQAQYDLTQNFTKAHTPDELKTFQQKEGNYSVNNALDWIKQLEGTQAADTYKGTEAIFAASHAAFEEKTQQDLKQFNSSLSGGSSNSDDSLLGGLFGGGGGAPDAGQKRCLELGGAYKDCMGLIDTLTKLIGGDTNEIPSLNGVVLAATYHSRTDLPGLMFKDDGNAALQKCGSLVDDDHTYTIRKSGSTTQFVLNNEPDPIILTLRSDGSLSGPGSISVKGNIITGYHNQYVCTNGTCTTNSTPVYSPKIDRCTLTSLALQPPPPPPPPQAKQTGLLGGITDMMGGDSTFVPIYGFRMTGVYAEASGLKLQFNNNNVTLDCGQAHVNVPYTIDTAQSQFIVHVQNGGGAFLLTVAPDNTLRGSGTTTVSGKLVSAMNGESVSFTPHSESCAVGTFMPSGKQNTQIASNAPTAAVPVSYASSPAPVSATPASVGSAPSAPAGVSRVAAPAPAASSAAIEASLAGAGISSAPTGARASFRILLGSSFTGANLLAGQSVFVMRKPMDQALRELGVPMPAGATSGQAMQALKTQCHAAAGCTSTMSGLGSYFVTTTKLDGSGKAILAATAATGVYYLYAIIPDGSGTSLMWDVPANLQAGDNTVTFTSANAERVP
jgi:hypothetical protein